MGSTHGQGIGYKWSNMNFTKDGEACGSNCGGAWCWWCCCTQRLPTPRVTVRFLAVYLVPGEATAETRSNRRTFSACPADRIEYGHEAAILAGHAADLHDRAGRRGGNLCPSSDNRKAKRDKTATDHRASRQHHIIAGA